MGYLTDRYGRKVMTLITTFSLIVSIRMAKPTPSQPFKNNIAMLLSREESHET